MINSVTLKNFRRLRDTTVPLSKVTLLTGTNGVGKTSILEGLYCLFSETRLDVSYLVRYQRALGITLDLSHRIPNIGSRPAFNYKLFWKECPMFNEQSCCVSAKSDTGTTWEWTYTETKRPGLDAKIIKYAEMMGINIDNTTDVALFKWQINSVTPDKKTPQKNTDNCLVTRAQIMSPDGGLYLIPPKVKKTSFCRYLDFASMKVMPSELPYQTAKKLTEALKIINPLIKDIRISKIENGLSVILEGDKETTLGTIGNGAVTWAGTLMAILGLVEQFNIDQQTNIPVFVLVDEIGAGIHYSVMNDIWKYIRDFMAEYPNIQLVATSHSDDCVRAFCEVFIDKGQWQDASIVRLHATANDEIVSTQYNNSSQFKTIISEEWEVRG